MQRIAVAAQRADAETVVVKLLLELVKLRLVVEHRQLAVRIARIVSCTQLDRIDVELLELFENFIQRKLRQQAP